MGIVALRPAPNASASRLLRARPFFLPPLHFRAVLRGGGGNYLSVTKKTLEGRDSALCARYTYAPFSGDRRGRASRHP